MLWRPVDVRNCHWLYVGNTGVGNRWFIVVSIENTEFILVFLLLIIVLLLYNYCINCKPTFAHPCTFTVLSVFFKLTVYKIKNQSLVLFQLSVNCGDLCRVQRSEDHSALPVPPAPDTGVSAWRTVRPAAITPGPWFLISDCHQLCEGLGQSQQLKKQQNDFILSGNGSLNFDSKFVGLKTFMSSCLLGTLPAVGDMMWQAASWPCGLRVCSARPSCWGATSPSWRLGAGTQTPPHAPLFRAVGESLSWQIFSPVCRFKEQRF